MDVRAPTTQKMIAEALGVSQALVSVTLNNRAGRIGASEETVRRIRAEAQRRGYTPNATALELRGASTRTLGVMVKDFEDPYFGRLIGALQTLTRKEGFSLLLTGGSSTDLAPLVKHRVDGVILAGSDFFPQELHEILSVGTPVARIGSGRRSPLISQVSLDEEMGLLCLVEHLLAQGHQILGFVGDTSPSGRRRGRAFARSLRQSGISKERVSQFLVEESCQIQAEEVVRHFRKMNPQPTALVAMDDRMAIELLRAFGKAGGRVPEDLAIAGVDDIPMAAEATPSLTTLQQPFQEMAEAALRCLSGRETRRTIRLQGRLVIRDSTISNNKNTIL